MSVNTKIPKDAVIVVAGVVGAGKSTLAQWLSDKLGYTLNREVVDGNPYLEKYYDDQATWSFHLQIYFLTQRFKDLRKAFELDGGFVFDRSIYEDSIFAKLNYKAGTMTEADYHTYKDLFKTLVYSPYFVHPDLIIYLEGDLDTVLGRIKRRGREMELKTPVSYWENLGNAYQEWIEDLNIAPVLRLNIADYDLDKDPNCFEDILKKIEHKFEQIESTKK